MVRRTSDATPWKSSRSIISAGADRYPAWAFFEWLLADFLALDFFGGDFEDFALLAEACDDRLERLLCDAVFARALARARAAARARLARERDTFVSGLFQPTARSARKDFGMSSMPPSRSVTASSAASARSARTSLITLAGRRAVAACTRLVSRMTNIRLSGSIQSEVPV